MWFSLKSLKTNKKLPFNPLKLVRRLNLYSYTDLYYSNINFTLIKIVRRPFCEFSIKFFFFKSRTFYRAGNKTLKYLVLKTDSVFKLFTLMVDSKKKSTSLNVWTIYCLFYSMYIELYPESKIIFEHKERNKILSQKPHDLLIWPDFESSILSFYPSI